MHGTKAGGLALTDIGLDVGADHDKRVGGQFQTIENRGKEGARGLTDRLDRAEPNEIWGRLPSGRQMTAAVAILLRMGQGSLPATSDSWSPDPSTVTRLTLTKF